MTNQRRTNRSEAQTTTVQHWLPAVWGVIGYSPADHVKDNLAGEWMNGTDVRSHTAADLWIMLGQGTAQCFHAHRFYGFIRIYQRKTAQILRFYTDLSEKKINRIRQHTDFITKSVMEVQVKTDVPILWSHRQGRPVIQISDGLVSNAQNKPKSLET